MPDIARTSGFAHAAAVMVPLLALSGCAAALLPELAAMPETRVAFCAPSVAGTHMPGCNAGAAGAVMPPLANARQQPAPVTQVERTAPPCARDSSGPRMPDCDAGATAAIFEGLASSLQRLVPAVSAPR